MICSDPCYKYIRDELAMAIDSSVICLTLLTLSKSRALSFHASANFLSDELVNLCWINVKLLVDWLVDNEVIIALYRIIALVTNPWLVANPKTKSELQNGL